MHDSHVHLSLSPLKENLKRVLVDFKEDNGKYILDMGTEPSDWVDVLGLKNSDSYSDTILIGIGVHPTIFDENLPNLKKGIDLFKFSTKILQKLEDTYKENYKIIDAVGETGLDYYQMFNKEITEEQRKDLKEIQQRSFRQHCQISMKYNLPMSIHARELLGRDECINDTLKIVAEEGRGEIRGVFHSYTGSKEGLQKILDMGFYVGFNAIITYPSGENVRELLKETPIDRILFETDGPFLPTQETRKNKNDPFPFGKPTDVREIMGIAAEIKGISVERLEKETDKIFELLFGNSLN